MKTSIPTPLPPVPSWAAFKFTEQCNACPYLKNFFQCGGVTHGAMPLPGAPLPMPTPPAPTVIGRKAIDVLTEMLASKRAANRRERYIKSLHYYWCQFLAGRENILLTEISVAVIEQWLAKHKNASTKQGWLSRISTLFSFAVRRDYLDKNPCDKIEPIIVERKPPYILTPLAANTAYKICQPSCRAWMILCLWCGLRPTEAEQIKWEDIDFRSGTVTVMISKVRRFRVVNMLPRAVELLWKLRKLSGRVAPSESTLRRAKRKMRKALGLERWPQDIMRHTAASYWLALTGDASKVATQLGNSPKILLTHYNGLASPDDAKEFFKSKLTDVSKLVLLKNAERKFKAATRRIQTTTGTSQSTPTGALSAGIFLRSNN